MKKEKIIKLKELEFKDFILILDFLNEQCKEIEDKGEKIASILRRLDFFFPSYSKIEEILIKSMIQEIIENINGAEEKFKQLKSNFPEVEFNLMGNSKPLQQTMSGVKLELLEKMFDKAKEEILAGKKNMNNSQIYEAKTLEKFKNIKCKTNYGITKSIFLRKFKTGEDDIEKIEKNLKDLNCSVESINTILATYIKNKNNNIKTFSTLLKHFRYRLEIACLDFIKNGKFTNEENEKFVKNLKDSFK